MDAKTTGIVAYITWIGLVIAFVLGDREVAKFHLNQALVVSLVTSTLTTKTKEQDRLRMENEKVKMRADLLRSVSHDIRTPLTSIMGATSAILENPALSPAEQQSLLVDVRDDAQWLIRVV